ncbi:MAG: hypothetical protein KJO18_03005, partial [Acidimicrobiia bacterium]|nr:hypothetical protein [Acidimicrobiia bacterium]
SLWEPLAVAFGVMAFYGMVVVIASFYVRQRIGQTAWRMIHYLSFGVFASSAAHGLMAGTDSGNPVVIGLYGSTIAAVVMLTILRGFLAKGAAEKPAERVPRKARRTPTAAKVSTVESSESGAAAPGEPVLAGQSTGAPKP